MFGIFGITPRQAFIDACLIMVGIDQKTDEREQAKFAEVLVRYGFSGAEIRKEIEAFSSMSMKQGMKRGANVMASLKKLDLEMQKNLLQALKEIAEADDEFHDAEKTMLAVFKMGLAAT